MITKMEKYLKCFEYIQKNKPLAKLFRTDNFSYLYDTGTAKVVQCEELEFNILEAILSNNSIKESIEKLSYNIDEIQLFNAIENIYNTIKKEDLLNVEVERKFESQRHFGNLKEEISSGLRQIVLEVTERCNLRCRYCTYNEEYVSARNHGVNDMSLQVAYTAIDYLAAHGSKEEVFISFYGGEPLLMYDLIKKSVEYAQKTIKVKKLNFTMTTNLTLVTPEIAEYLCSIENFSVVGSLDGPKAINDEFRKDICGNGTFDRAIIGLKNIMRAFGDLHKNRVLLSMVYTPPYSEKRLNEIQDLFNSFEWLPKSIKKTITYPAQGSIPEEYCISKGIEDASDRSLTDWSQEKFFENIVTGENKGLFTEELIANTLLKVHEREITEKAQFDFPLNGCCIPGKQRLYISPSGKIRTCERILGEKQSGNILKKIDVDNIKKIYVDEYSKLSSDTCLQCWIAKSCSQCYAKVYKNGLFDLEERNANCKIEKETFLSALKFYHKCYEQNPDSLLYLNDVKILT